MSSSRCGGPSDRRFGVGRPAGATLFSAGALLVVVFAACSKEPARQTAERETPTPMPMASMEARPAVYNDSTLAFPHLQFTDGSVTLNDRCPVRKVKLNRGLPPVFVNGHPVGFC